MRPWYALPLLLLIRPVPESGRRDLGIWYWHVPFRLTEDESATLKRMGVETLYVRAATFTTDGVHAKTMLPQRWESAAKGFKVVLTMNFDPGLLSHLGTLPVKPLADDVIRGIRQAKSAAKGVEVVGVQLDIDCPTRLLPRYADLLRRIRPAVEGEFSITALPTWLGSPNIREVADAVDFIAPQFYENTTGKTLATLAPVSDTKALQRGLRRLRMLGIPYRAGLAAYGHSLLYDDDGHLAGMYRGLGPEDALRHPSLAPEAAGELGDERKLILKAVAPDAQGRGQGVRIAYVLPTAEALRQQLEVYRQNLPDNDRGAILYRFPEAEEAMTLPLPTQEAALRNRKAVPRLDVKLSAHAMPWDLIAPDSRAERPPQALRLVASVGGEGPSEARRGAVQLLIRLDRPGVERLATGDFDEAELGNLGPDGRFRKTSGLRADAIRLRRSFVLPGDVLRTGAIELVADGAVSAEAEWVVASPDGTTSGRSAKLNLRSDQ